MDEDTLIGRLKQQISTGKSPSEEYGMLRQYADPPLTMADLIEAEAKLGFSLPPLLKRIYCEVGNGGFGPGYRLYKFALDPSVDDRYDRALVDTYLALHPPGDAGFSLSPGEESAEGQQPICYYEYPPQVLMICDWGCNIYSFIDCSSPEYRVLRKDHNYSLTEHVLECPSFHQWLEGWLNGVPLFYACLGETRKTWEQGPDSWERSANQAWEAWKHLPKVLFSPSRD
jgi:hypothetical protein